MKRFVWITILLVSLLFAGKLALKPAAQQGPGDPTLVSAVDTHTAAHRQVAVQSDDSELLARYADQR